MGFIEGIMTTGLEVLKGLNGLGLAGRVGYVCGLGVWTLLCLPTTPVELAAGVSFPLLSCCAMSAAGKTVGSLVALLLGRRQLMVEVQLIMVRKMSLFIDQKLT